MEIVILLVACAFALAVPIVCGCVCAHLAGKKGRNKVGYFFLGFFFTLIGIIIVLLVDDLNVSGRRKRVVYEEYVDDEDER